MQEILLIRQDDNSIMCE